ncbi:MAG: NUDIX hydrolase [Alphaproteobacteria bacterium]|nr:NUDIX hydrolase [Alphaproteobacteria bacterium]
MKRLPIFQGRVVDLGIETVELPDGRSVELEVIRHPGAAAVVPLHDDGTVTLIHQLRHAGGGMMVEIPAGLLEEGEIPDLAARRELSEETGLRCERLDTLGTIHTTPGFTDERIWIFAATGLTEGEMNLDDDEHLEPMRIPLDRALDMIDEGDITDAKTICGLTMAARWLARRG